MTAGFEVRRNDGKISVSSMFPHYRFVKKLRGTDNFWDSSGTQYTPHVIVAFRPVTVSAELHSFRFSKGRMILWHYSSNQPQPPAGATLSLYASTEVDAYIYDIAPVLPSAAGYGLQVFTPAGQMTFDVAGRYMRLLDVLQGEAPISARPWEVEVADPLVFQYAASHKLAVVPLKQGFHIDYDSSAEEQSYGLTWQAVSTGSVTVQMVYYQENYGGSSSGVKQHRRFNALVVDVNNVEAI